MRIIKNDNQGVLTSPLMIARQSYLAVTSIIGFKLGISGKIITEQALWNELSEYLDGGILDAGMPKHTGEFLIKGNAYNDDPLRQHRLVAIRFAGIEKKLEVHGERTWLENGLASEAKPFSQVPLDWAHTYGFDNFLENPYGKSAIKPAQVNYPGKAQYTKNDVIKPGSFGPLDAEHPQRRRYMGKYGSKWFRDCWPGYPDDFKLRFFNTAPIDQQLPGWIPKASNYALINMHPEQREITGSLPKVRSRVFLLHEDSNSKEHFSEMKMNCDTCWFFPDKELGVLIFHGLFESLDDECADIKTLVMDVEENDIQKDWQEYFETSQLSPTDLAMRMSGLEDNSAERQLEAEKAFERLDESLADIVRNDRFTIRQNHGEVPTPSYRTDPFMRGINLFNKNSWLSNMMREMKTNGDMASYDALEDIRKGAALMEEQQKKLESSRKHKLNRIDDPNLKQQFENRLDEALLNNDEWSELSSELVAFSQCFVDSRKREWGIAGLRYSAVERYFLGYLDTPYLVKSKEWLGLDHNIDIYIGPGWVLPLYDGDKFTSIVIRPESLLSEDAQYFVPGSQENVGWYSNKRWHQDIDIKVILIVDNLFHAWLFAQDLDEEIIVIYLQSVLSIDESLFLEADHIVIPKIIQNSADEVINELRANYRSLVELDLPENCLTVSDFFEFKHKPRDWLFAYLPSSKIPAPTFDEIRQSYFDANTGGLEPSLYIQEQEKKSKAKIQEGISLLDKELQQKASTAYEKAIVDAEKDALGLTTITDVISRFKLLNEKSSASVLEQLSKNKNLSVEQKQLMLGKLAQGNAELKDSLDELLEVGKQTDQINNDENNGDGITERDKFDRAKFIEAYQKGQSLKGLDLSGINLTGLTLEELDLSGCNLTEADFSNSFLSKCQFTEIIASKASFEGATLNECDFTVALLMQANFSNVSASACLFTKTMLSEANLANSSFIESSFQQTLLSKSNMTSTDMTRSDLSHILAFEANLNNARLENCNLEKAIFNESDMQGVNMRHSYGAGCNMWEVNAERACLDESTLLNLALGASTLNLTSFKNGIFHQLTMDGAYARQADFSGSVLDGAYINNSHFTEANLSSIRLRNGQVVRTRLQDSDLSRSDFMRTNLYKSTFIDVKLDNTSLFQANLLRVSISNVSIKNTNLKQTLLDGKTDIVNEFFT